MDESLDKIPTEDLPVATKVLNPQSKIGTEDFNKELYKLLASSKEVWRKSSTLAVKLDVDVVDLDNFLRQQQIVACRPAKDEGVSLYALVKRLETDEKEPPQQRLLVNEEDRYAIASLHNCLMLLEATLQKYALKIAERSSESFTNLLTAKERLEVGVVLLATKLKINLNKLPNVSNGGK